MQLGVGGEGGKVYSVWLGPLLGVPDICVCLVGSGAQGSGKFH